MNPKTIFRITTAILFGALFVAATVSAHQPKINQDLVTYVQDPEISKAYFGQLNGENHIYKISSDKEFNLYVGVLVPDLSDQKKDVSAAIIQNGNLETPFAVLDGINFEWKPFFEEFARDNYLWGPDFRGKVPAGQYDVIVWSSNNDSWYSLAIGEAESFGFSESFDAIRIIPEIKARFFGESPAGFIFSPFGYGYILIMFLLASIFGFAYRAILKKFASGTSHGLTHNIGKKDKIFRIVLGIALLLWAIFTTWSPWLLFFSGFCFFEAIFSWCGVYAALGKNTCPL